MRGCLRLVYGAGGTQALVERIELDKDGRLLARSGDGAFEQTARFRLPPSAREHPFAFEVFVFANQELNDTALSQICTEKMVEPGYVCRGSEDCWFALRFYGYTGDASTKPKACQFVPPKAKAEPVNEMQADEPVSDQPKQPGEPRSEPDTPRELTADAAFDAVPDAINDATMPPISWASALKSNKTTINDVAIDAKNNIFVVGTYSGVLSMGTNTLKRASSQRAFIAGFDIRGKVRWLLGIDAISVGKTIGVDSVGNVYVAGEYWGAGNAGGGALPKTSHKSIFLTKLSAIGSWLGTATFAGTGDLIVNEMLVLAPDDVVLVGGFSGELELVPGSRLTSLGIDFLALRHKSGVVLWSRSFQEAGSSEATSVVLDSKGSLIVVGSFNGVFSLPKPLTDLKSDMADGFLFQIDLEGRVIGREKIGGSGIDRVLSASTDNVGNIYVAGVYQGAMMVGSSNLGTSGSLSAGFVATFDSDLRAISAFDFKAKGNGAIGSVVFSQQKLFALFSFEGDLAFAMGQQNTTKRNRGKQDAAVLMYATTGKLLNVTHIGGSEIDAANAVVVDSYGKPIVVGHFHNNVGFGRDVLMSRQQAGFVWRLP